jgi:hypothetical protein
MLSLRLASFGPPLKPHIRLLPTPSLVKFSILSMSRRKVKEDILGPLAQGGAHFTIQTWNCYLNEGDADPVTIEHELPFNVSTRLIE